MSRTYNLALIGFGKVGREFVRLLMAKKADLREQHEIEWRLTEMERGLSLEEAVNKAQELDVTETDPADDLDGWDAAVKVAALVIVLMGLPITLEQVERTGIQGLSGEQVRKARASGTPYKLICSAERKAEGVRANVRPELLPMTDPLALLEGGTSAVTFDLGVFALSIMEDAPGLGATAYGLLADFVRAVT